MDGVKEQIQDALKHVVHLQDLVATVETRPVQVHAIPAKRSVPPTVSERAHADVARVSNVFLRARKH